MRRSVLLLAPAGRLRRRFDRLFRSALIWHRHFGLVKINLYHYDEFLKGRHPLDKSKPLPGLDFYAAAA